MSELTHEDVRKILSIIDSIGDCTVTLELGDIKLHMTRGGEVQAFAPSAAAPAAAAAAPAAGPVAAAPVAAPVPPAAKPAQAIQGKHAVQIPDGAVAVTAPSSGTFYRAASPAAKPFVEVGDRVEASDTVGIFDVMKLFISLSAGVKGTVTAILVENQTVAEQGQPLLLIEPD